MFLLCIVFIPFPTALMVRYNYWISTAFYAATIAAAGFVLACSSSTPLITIG
ncbi:MAG: hypothetical protein ACXV2E_07990 [Halobacteriota archaeon]